MIRCRSHSESASIVRQKRPPSIGVAFAWSWCSPCFEMNDGIVFFSRKHFTQRSYGSEHFGVLKSRPHHAHDKVIDAKSLVISLHLVFHERLVADNEAIL